MTAPGSLMRAEIDEQPEAVERTLRAVTAPAAALAEAMQRRSVEVVVLVARGTSDHAAVYARYLLEAGCGLIATLAAPSLYTTYRAPVDLRRALAIGVSQSGRTPEIVSAMAYARERGALTAAVTNDGSAALAAAVDVPLVTAAGEERSVAATKTFTAQLAAFAALGSALGAGGLDDLPALPDAIARTLALCAGPASDAAASLTDAPAAVCVARGLGFCVALEAALKLKETAAIWAEGFSAADLRHGPAAAVAGLPALVFHGGGPLAADVEAVERELVGRGARVVAVGPGRSVPTAPASEPLAPFGSVVAAQILAERLARLRGHDPDRPAGLTKVTATR